MAYSRPPTAGPMIVAACPAEEFHTAAVANWCGGTRFESSATAAGNSNARATPKRKMIPKIGASLAFPTAVSVSNNSAQTNSRTTHKARTRRRS